MAKSNLPSNTSSITIPISNGTASTYYISGGGSGGSGTTWTTTTASPSTQFVNHTGDVVMEIPKGDQKVKITGEIEWNGENLNERLERIESMLHIPTRDVIIEEKYQKLKQLWDQYKTALEEYKTWQRLKDSK